MTQDVQVGAERAEMPLQAVGLSNEEIAVMEATEAQEPSAPSHLRKIAKRFRKGRDVIYGEIDVNSELTLVDMRIFDAYLASIDPENNVYYVRIYLEQFADTFGYSSLRAKDLMKYTNKLLRTTVSIPTSGKNGIKNGYESVPLFSYLAVRRDEDGKLCLFLLGNTFARQLLSDLRSYKVIDLTEKGKLTSKYAYAFYDICSDVVRFGHKKLSTETLRKALGVKDNLYGSWLNFRQRCIDPAVEQINAFTRFQVSFSTIKTGREHQITEVILYVEEKGKTRKSSTGQSGTGKLDILYDGEWYLEALIKHYGSNLPCEILPNEMYAIAKLVSECVRQAHSDYTPEDIAESARATIVNLYSEYIARRAEQIENAAGYLYSIVKDNPKAVNDQMPFLLH